MTLNPSSYKVGDTLELDLESVAFGGEAVGRIEGLVVFVRGGIDGEKVLIEIDEVRKNYLKAHIKEILKPSPHRTEPHCSVYGQCGGCQYQHIEYSHQLKLKEAQVRDSLERIGHLKDFSLDPILGSHDPYGYRSRVDFHVTEDLEGFKTGFVAFDGRTILDVPHCPICTPGINTQYQLMRNEIRAGRFDIPSWVEIIKCWQTKSEADYFFLNTRGQVDLKGKSYIELKACDKTFKVPPLSFFQVNLPMIPDLAGCVEKFLSLSGKEFLLDCYCGVGLFAILLAHQTKFCLGIESDQNAIQFARINAKESKLTNCMFIDKSVEKVLKHPQRFLDEVLPHDMKHSVPDRIIVDPTRAGCEQKFLDALIRLGVPKIVYVSCYPTTLARDLAYLVQNGYRVERIQPVDLFPQTQHCEVVASIRKN